jgi:hypothetical protein
MLVPPRLRTVITALLTVLMVMPVLPVAAGHHCARMCMCPHHGSHGMPDMPSRDHCRNHSSGDAAVHTSTGTQGGCGICQCSPGSRDRSTTVPGNMLAPAPDRCPISLLPAEFLPDLLVSMPGRVAVSSILKPPRLSD